MSRQRLEPQPLMTDRDDLKRMARLGEFARFFGPGGFAEAGWRNGNHRPGRPSEPAFGKVICALRPRCEADGWLLADFDWLDWSKSSEAVTLRQEQWWLAEVTPDQMAKMLTVIFLGDDVAVAIESGLLVGVLLRARTLGAKKKRDRRQRGAAERMPTWMP